MRRLFTILVSVLISAGLFAQTPQKISYQAVIRDSNNALITNTTIGIQISILQGSSTGSTVYAETQNPTTNINGLASIEIGEGAVVSGTFATIDWSNDTYFIKTETDPSGSTNYTITGTSQILSVPYALHSKTAETLTGTISETDPIYNSSIASGITASDTANWNNKLAIETDPVFTSWDKSSGISISESQISDLNHFTSADETDPIYNSSIASSITASDTANWNNKLAIETDPVFTSWDKSSGISISESQISDLNHFTSANETDPIYNSSIASSITASDTANWNNKLAIETDPVFTSWDKSSGISISESQISDLNHFTSANETDPIYNSSIASSITASDTTNWNNKLAIETDPVFTSWDKSSGISISESQISDLNHFTSADETDPIYNSSIASSITASDTANWNNKLAIETDPVFTSWDKSSGISISESQISDLNHFTSANETDPIYNSSIASSITASDTANWNNKLAIETDPVFTSWDKSSGISISESQISDLNHFTSANETDPIYNSSIASSITASDTTNWNNKLAIETDPVFTSWDKSSGISISESQISDLNHFTSADETDPIYNSSIASGIIASDTANWNNKLATETDPVFTSWDKSSGISISESQISDLNHFTSADETDPIYNSSIASSITASDTANWNNKLATETDPVFTSWDKSSGISISESQISDLNHFTSADETDPIYNSSIASGITASDTANWNNKQKLLTAGTGIDITENVISTTSSVSIYSIGDSIQGGIIFWLDNTGQHGLIAATTDQSTESKWFNNSYTTTNATRDGIGAGMFNTERIISNQGPGNYAAELCANYKGGGYGDWYLPSQYELNLLYQQNSIVGGLNTGGYWSSNESTNNQAWMQAFGYYGYKSTLNKASNARVRAIRAF